MESNVFFQTANATQHPLYMLFAWLLLWCWVGGKPRAVRHKFKKSAEMASFSIKSTQAVLSIAAT